MPTIYKSSGKGALSPGKPGSQQFNPQEKLAPMRPLAAFAMHPDGVRFETQEEAEIVELFLRQHPIVNIPWIMISFILIIAPAVVFPVALHFAPFEIPIRFIVVFTVFWYVATFGFILTNLLRWFFNIYIVTNERIVDIDFMFLLYKHFAEAELDKIQDISFTTSGFAATIFNYGNVLVQTAGELPDLEFEMVPHPQKIVETIRSLAENVQGGKL